MTQLNTDIPSVTEDAPQAIDWIEILSVLWSSRKPIGIAAKWTNKFHIS